MRYEGKKGRMGGTRGVGTVQRNGRSGRRKMKVGGRRGTEEEGGV